MECQISDATAIRRFAGFRIVIFVFTSWNVLLSNLQSPLLTRTRPTIRSWGTETISLLPDIGQAPRGPKTNQCAVPSQLLPAKRAASCAVLKPECFV